jgi:phage protein D
MDPTVLMHLEEKVKAWPNMADSDVASAIFSDRAYGFTPVVDTTKWKRDENDHTLIQRGSDIQFLTRLADRNGFECFVEVNDETGDVEGHFHAPKHDQNPQGVLSVNMGSATNVDNFAVRFDMLGPTTAHVTGLDIASDEDQPAESTEAEQKELGSTKSTDVDRPRTVLLSGTGMANGGELQLLAQAVVDRSAWAIIADGELNATAYGGVLRAKRPVSVRGAGRTFSGTYYVEKVLHSLTSDGYTQRFTLRRNAVGLTGREKFTDDGAAA